MKIFENILNPSKNHYNTELRKDLCYKSKIKIENEEYQKKAIDVIAETMSNYLIQDLSVINNLITRDEIRDINKDKRNTTDNYTDIPECKYTHEQEIKENDERYNFLNL